MKKLTRRISVGVMAVSLVMSSSLVAFAEDPKTGTSGGTGSMEGIVETDVFKVDLPTEATDAYDYFADPQGLIRKTDAARYEGAEFGEGNVFFANADGSYSNTSDAATIVNKSSAPLSVAVKAKATVGGAQGAAGLATGKIFADTNTNLEVYLGLIDSLNAEKPLTATDTTEGTDAILKAVLGAAPEDAYEYSYTDGTGYAYAIKSDVSAFNFAEYSFQITGVANDKATWKADTVLPTVSVTWDVALAGESDTVTVATPDQTPPAPAEAAPSIATTTYTATSGSPVAMTVDLGTGAKAAEGIAKVRNVNANIDVPATRYSFSGTTLTLDATFIKNNMTDISSANGLKLSVVFSDTANTAVEITITAASE